MAYSFPATISTGDVLTASTWNQAIRENQKFGMATFTNEAARDAAITSPEEGMRAYLTAPTVPAATGATTAIPTGVTTVYNGSVWVCTTPVSAITAAIGTTTSATFTASLSGTPGTNPSATLVTGTTALVSIAANVYSSAAGAGPTMSVAVSGAGTVAASDDFSLELDPSAANYATTLTWTAVITGLTAGANTFTLQYRARSNTSSFRRRSITVVGIA